MRTPFPRAARGRIALAAAVGGAMLALAACGSDSGDTPKQAASSGASSACTEKAKAYLKSWDTFATTLPKSPPSRYTTLSSPPPTSKKIVYLRQNFPAGASTFKGIEQGAKALGWQAQSVIFDSTLPDLIAKFEQVIAQKPDFISESGFPAAAIQKQIESAKAAGITVILTSTTDQPVSVPGLGGAGNGIGTTKLIANVQAYKALADSNCSANTVIFSLDYPIIKVAEDEYKKVIASNCPKCKVKVVTIQAKDIGTPAMTSQMVSTLQADPSTKYAYTVIGDLAGGLAQALKTAGLDDVRIFGQVPNETSIASLRAGTNAWWVLQSSYVNGLDTVDMAARIAATGEMQTDTGGYPLALLTKENVPPGESVPVVPQNIADLYEQTWGVG